MRDFRVLCGPSLPQLAPDGQLRFHALPKPTPSKSPKSRWTPRPSLACPRDTVGRSTALMMPSTSSPTSSVVLGDRQLLGASPGEQTRKLVHPVRELDSPDEALAEVGGINVQVGLAIDGRDRKRLERLCRYMARPPVCQERLAVTESGRVVVRFKNAWRSGSHAVVLDPLDFIARLVALIPPPHFNMIRYHARGSSQASQRGGPGCCTRAARAKPTAAHVRRGGGASRSQVRDKPASRHPGRGCFSGCSPSTS
jgi:hypothetical protein